MSIQAVCLYISILSISLPVFSSCLLVSHASLCWTNPLLVLLKFQIKGVTPGPHRRCFKSMTAALVIWCGSFMPVMNYNDDMIFLYPHSKRERDRESAPEKYCPWPDDFFSFLWHILQIQTQKLQQSTDMMSILRSTDHFQVFLFETKQVRLWISRWGTTWAELLTWAVWLFWSINMGAKMKSRSFRAAHASCVDWPWG